MPTKMRAILLIGLISGLAGLFILLSKGDPTEEHGLSRKECNPSSGHPTAAAGLTDEALPSKSKPRSPTPKVSKSRTRALLETPIPGTVEFPEQTVLERIEAINEWLEESGIPRGELRIFVAPASAERLREKELHCKDFSASHLSPRLLLGALFDVSALRYRVVNGGVEMHYLR